jgi:phenylpropionate dioxygenase-like ring-hydroxylating dioxygenase large terminal subunit
MADVSNICESADELEQSVIVGPEAYVSADYARDEQDKLWRKAWLQAGRMEDIPNVGDFITFDILTDSVIVVRTGEDEIEAYHNVCPHRGRRLIDTPPGQRNARGTRKNIICGFHGWTFGLDGKNTFVEHETDWNGSLCGGRADLGKVKVDTWSGWLWINLDPESGPLSDYLDPVPTMLAPYQLQNMRARWRKWVVFECTWKVAMEAFAETYHVNTTHPEFMEFGQFRGWARNQKLHSNIGYEAPKGQEEDSGKLRLGTGEDPRVTTAEMQNFTWENANTNTTTTLVAVANRLKDEVPDGTPAAEVSAYWINTAKAEDAARGVVWPSVDSSHTSEAGTAWQIFPNFQIGHAVNNMLCYQARPFKIGDADHCIFEAAVYELYPDGEAPETDWVYTEPADWPPVLQQDFTNMAAVQQGMKNVGFRGAQLNPYMERSIASLHMNLAKFMGAGAPRKAEGRND